jgi:hypothetical protein
VCACLPAKTGARAFALDTRSKRRWDCPPLADTNAAAFRRACVAFGFSPAQILPHGGQRTCAVLHRFVYWALPASITPACHCMLGNGVLRLPLHRCHCWLCLLLITPCLPLHACSVPGLLCPPH